MTTTLQESLTQYIKSLTSSVHTQRAYKIGCEKFFKYLCDFQGFEATSTVDQLTFEHTIQFAAWLSDQELAKSSLRVYIDAVKRYADRLVVDGTFQPTLAQIRRFEMALANYERKHESHLPDVPTDEEMLAITEFVLKRYKTYSPLLERNRAMIFTLRDTGMRRQELANLQVRDIDFDQRVITIRGGKGDKDRRVFFTDQTRDLIAAYWRARGWHNQPDFPIFGRHDRAISRKPIFEPMTAQAIYSVVKSVTKKIGKSFSPHKFRHFLVTFLLNETGDINFVGDIAGHSSASTTKRYVHIADARRAEKYHRAFEAIKD